MSTPSFIRFCFLLLLFSPNLLSAQWTKTNGLSGGTVSSFLRFGDTIVVNAGRLHYSTDDGQTWAPLKASGCYYTYQLAKEGNNLYAYGERVGVGKVVSWSNDFGQTWTWSPLPANLYFDSFVATNGFLYGNDYQHIYRSADHGLHWDTLPTFVYKLKVEGQRMVGLQSTSLVESFDGGFTWDTLLQSGYGFINIELHENYLFAFGYGVSDTSWVSSDYGQTWQQFTSLEFNQFYNFVWHDGTIFALQGTYIYRSNDLGVTWASSYFTDFYPAYAGISSSGSILIGGEYSGVMRSTDFGESWFTSNQGLFAATPPQLSITNQGLFAPTARGIFRLQSDSVTWSNMGYAIVPAWNEIEYTAFLQSANNLVLCVGAKVCWVSTDGGTTWVKSSVPDSWSYAGAATLLSLADGQIMAILDNGDGIRTYISDDHGISFHGLSALSVPFNTYMRHFDINSGQVYFLADDGNIYQSGDGHQWSLLSDNVPVDSLDYWFDYGSQVFVRGNSIWVFASSKLGFSTDLGQTWTIHTLSSAGFNWGTNGFRDLLQVGTYLFAATERGIFYSNDGGLNWTDWNEGLEMQVGDVLQYYDGYVWAGMNSDGIWKRPVSDLGIISTKTIVGSVSSLSLHVFPNPVTDVARLDLPTTGLLTVTDAAGHTMWKSQVTTGRTELKVRDWPAGTYQLLFNNGKEKAQGVMIVQH